MPRVCAGARAFARVHGPRGKMRGWVDKGAREEREKESAEKSEEEREMRAGSAVREEYSVQRIKARYARRPVCARTRVRVH